MLRTLRNLTVNVMAAFIRDRDERHKFRNKYKRKSKFRKLRDDNRQILTDIDRLLGEVKIIKTELNALEEKYNERFYGWDRERSLEFRVLEWLHSLPTNGPEDEVILSIACVSKNEGPYIREWIEYHKIVGVERFYFYDNESDDNTKEILEPYIKDGTVVYHFLPNHPITNKCPHIESINDAIFKYRDKTKWMAIIDLDEFIVPVQKDTIPEFLEEYEQYPAVVINWVCFDSNGHDKKPNSYGGLLTANYTRVRKDNSHPWLDRCIKSIVNPKLVVRYTSEHEGLYYQRYAAVTENFQRSRGITKVQSVSKIRINHYITKSREEYINKIKRNQKNMHPVYNINEERINFPGETTTDLVIQKYVPKLMSVLGIRS